MGTTTETIGTDCQGRTTRTMPTFDGWAEITEMTAEDVAQGWPNYVVRFEWDSCIYYADSMTDARVIAKAGPR